MLTVTLLPPLGSRSALIGNTITSGKEEEEKNDLAFTHGIFLMHSH